MRRIRSSNREMASRSIGQRDDDGSRIGFRQSLGSLDFNPVPQTRQSAPAWCASRLAAIESVEVIGELQRVTDEENLKFESLVASRKNSLPEEALRAAIPSRQAAEPARGLDNLVVSDQALRRTFAEACQEHSRREDDAAAGLGLLGVELRHGSARLRTGYADLRSGSPGPSHRLALYS